MPLCRVSVPHSLFPACCFHSPINRSEKYVSMGCLLITFFLFANRRLIRLPLFFFCSQARNLRSLQSLQNRRSLPRVSLLVFLELSSDSFSHLLLDSDSSMKGPKPPGTRPPIRTSPPVGTRPPSRPTPSRPPHPGDGKSLISSNFQRRHGIV